MLPSLLLQPHNRPADLLDPPQVGGHREAVLEDWTPLLIDLRHPLPPTPSRLLDPVAVERYGGLGQSRCRPRIRYHRMA